MTRKELNDDAAAAKSIIHLQTLKGALSVLKPQIHQANEESILHLQTIETKTAEFKRRFSNQICQYQQARAQLEELEVSAKRRDENLKALEEQLEQLSNELDHVKKETQAKGRGMTDSTHLFDTQRAIQQLKNENRELDILIGVLYHQLTQARKEGNEKKDDERMKMLHTRKLSYILRI